VTDPPFDPAHRARHWSEVYQGRDVETVSWYQPEPKASLQLIDALGVEPGQAVVDVGGGASLLVDRLLVRGFSDFTVLDISAEALAASRRRIGSDRRATWITQDLLSWQPRRQYDLWHDRAVFHFLTSDSEVDAYRMVLDRSLAADGAVVIGTFAPDGPTTCSGLPVARYDADGIASALGPRFAVVRRVRELHLTPGGTVQPFTWVALRHTVPRPRPGAEPHHYPVPMTLEGPYEPSPAAWVREQVEAYERSGGTEANTLRDTGLPIVIFTTVGRRSGKVRKTPVMRVEHGGEYALVASKGGAPAHPEWYHNLMADPDTVLLQDGPTPLPVRVRLVTGDERSVWWERAVAAYPPYADYQRATEREIPVFVASVID
jgi:deazaflavin-dependent oxidoreductase (nitroreductase family)